MLSSVLVEENSMRASQIGIKDFFGDCQIMRDTRQRFPSNMEEKASKFQKLHMPNGISKTRKTSISSGSQTMKGSFMLTKSRVSSKCGKKDFRKRIEGGETIDQKCFENYTPQECMLMNMQDSKIP
jgi:hypothetical protein